MAKKGVDKKHSETAIFGALHRAIANKEFNNERFGPDFLAEYFLPAHFKFFIRFKKIRANVKKNLTSLYQDYMNTLLPEQLILTLFLLMR